MKANRTRIMNGILHDHSLVTKKEVPVKVVIENGNLFIYPEGYGDCCSENGNGCPVMLEVWEGKLRLIVWSDINNDDPEEIISLEGAKEELRNAETTE